MLKFPEHFRVTDPAMPIATRPGAPYGAFRIGSCAAIAATHPAEMADGVAWEHVSVSCADRCPTWNEMQAVKSLFWDDEDRVIQYHPPQSEYINDHPYCLHLWRPLHVTIPHPPSHFVGTGAGSDATFAEAKRLLRR
jgi:hypothetical protein